jgi:hypothetical protein
MLLPEKFFHDRSILFLTLLLGISAVATTLLIVIRLGGVGGTNYVIEYRAISLNGAFHYGSIFDVMVFILFLAINTLVGLFVAMKAFVIKRPIALATIGVAALVNVIVMVVTNALLSQG